MLRGFSVSLRVILALCFTGVVALATGSMTALHVWSEDTTAETLAHERTLAVMHSLQGWLNGQLQPLETVVLNAQAMVESGVLDLTKTPVLDGYVHGLMASTPRLEIVALVTPDMTVRRYDRTGPVLIENWSDRPNVVAMLQALTDRARAGQTAPVWGEPLWRGNGGHTAFNVRVPLLREGKPMGTLIVMVGLGPILEALPPALAQEHITPYILYDHDAVLAHPLLDSGTLLDSTTVEAAQPLLSIREFPDLALAQLWSGPSEPSEQDGFEGAPLDEGLGEESAYDDEVEDWTRIVHVQDDTVIHTLREVIGYTPTPLLLGTYVSAQDNGAGRSERPWAWAAIMMGALALALGIALWLGTWIGRSLAGFSSLARSVAAGDLSRDPPPVPSWLHEFRDAHTAWTTLLDSLWTRERTRRLFGSSVPEDVARRLSARGGPTPTNHVEATVLFANLIGLTDVSQALDADRTIRLLTAYVSAMMTLAERHGGVVSWIRGDALLVVFNLPERHQDHATAAILSALAMEAHLDAAPLLEGYALSCRIGIGTGPVLAGAVGPDGRRGYTVYGEPVDLAIRLEGLTRTTGTRILISDRTAALAPSVPMTSLGKIPVRGQNADARVFTPSEDPAMGPTE